MGAGCCAGYSIRAFRNLETDRDVAEVGVSYEVNAPALVFPISIAWSRHIGCTAQRKVTGEDVLINVREDKDHIRVTYGPHTVPLPKSDPCGSTKEEALQIDSIKVRCKVVEYANAFVPNVGHTWLVWNPLDEMVSPGLPIKILHKVVYHKDKKEETTTWTQISLKDHFAENFQCRCFLELSGMDGASRRIAFLSAHAPGWVVQISTRSELCIEYTANQDLSCDAFLIAIFNDGEYHMYLSHMTP